MAYFRVTTRMVVKADTALDAQQEVDSLLTLVDGDSIEDGQVGDVDEVKQTWERV